MTNATFILALNSAMGEKKYFDENGFLINKDVPILRPGIIYYMGYELGMTGSNANRRIAVYRPPEQFDEELARKFSNILMTNDHPYSGVNSGNAKEEGVGNTGDRSYIRDGELWTETIIIRDEETIRDVESGKKQVSAGFRALYDFTTGIYEGVKYEAIEIIKEFNHLSIVAEGKNGPKYSLNQQAPFPQITKKEEIKMTTEVKVFNVMFNGITIEMSEQAAQAWNAREVDFNNKLITSINAVTEQLKTMKNSVDEVVAGFEQIGPVVKGGGAPVPLNKEGEIVTKESVVTTAAGAAFATNADEDKDKEDKKEDKKEVEADAKNADDADEKDCKNEDEEEKKDKEMDSKNSNSAKLATALAESKGAAKDTVTKNSVEDPTAVDRQTNFLGFYKAKMFAKSNNNNSQED